MNLRARANAHSDECEAFGMRGTASRRERSSVDGSVWWAQHRMRAMRAGRTVCLRRQVRLDARRKALEKGEMARASRAERGSWVPLLELAIRRRSRQMALRSLRAPFDKTPSQSRSIASTQILRAERLSHGRDTPRVSSPSTPRSPWSNWATCEWSEYYLCVAAEGVMRRVRARTGFRR
jgi:hypothetical protein